MRHRNSIISTLADMEPLLNLHIDEQSDNCRLLSIAIRAVDPDNLEDMELVAKGMDGVGIQLARIADTLRETHSRAWCLASGADAGMVKSQRETSPDTAEQGRE